MLGLLRPDSGSVRLFGQDVTDFSEDRFVEVRKDFGMVFQGSALFDSLTVFENVAYARAALPRRRGASGRRGAAPR
jgi:phospholipid/cholesterol/gamma-HCH transport system ATP-binding protein